MVLAKDIDITDVIPDYVDIVNLSIKLEGYTYRVIKDFNNKRHLLLDISFNISYDEFYKGE